MRNAERRNNPECHSEAKPSLMVGHGLNGYSGKMNWRAGCWQTSKPGSGRGGRKSGVREMPRWLAGSLLYFTHRYGRYPSGSSSVKIRVEAEEVSLELPEG
jgi:hypothetical protein